VTERYQLRKNNDDRWDFLAGVLPYKINPSDIDLVCERHGNFLVMEGKRSGATFSVGQRRLYYALSNLPQFTVVHFYGNPPDDVKAFARWGQEARAGTTDELREQVRRWFRWVESRTVPRRG